MSPDLDHPVVDLARRVVKRSPSGRYSIDELGVRVLELGLREQGDDPNIAGGVLGLFALAFGLVEEGSTACAAAIMKLLGRVTDELPGIRDRSAQQMIQLNHARYAEMWGDREPMIAPRIDAPPPAGSIKASSLLPHDRFKRDR